MTLYDITIVPDADTDEYKVVLHGPGIDPGGRRYIFANTYRCTAFAEAVNFAYEQGLRDGQRLAAQQTRPAPFDDDLLIVTGSTPEGLGVRSETWFARLRRRFASRQESK